MPVFRRWTSADCWKNAQRRERKHVFCDISAMNRDGWGWCVEDGWCSNFLTQPQNQKEQVKQTYNNSLWHYIAPKFIIQFNIWFRQATWRRKPFMKCSSDLILRFIRLYTFILNRTRVSAKRYLFTKTTDTSVTQRFYDAHPLKSYCRGSNGEGCKLFFFHYRCCRKPDLPVLKVSVYRACNLEFRAICELGIMVGEGTVKVAVKSSALMLWKCYVLKVISQGITHRLLHRSDTRVWGSWNNHPPVQIS